MRAYVRGLTKHLERLMGDAVAEKKTNIREIYEVGKSMGLTKDDISSLVRSSHGPHAKSLIRRYWYIFLPITFVIFLLVAYLSWYNSGALAGNTYPAGALYNVVGTSDFRRKISPSKTGVLS